MFGFAVFEECFGEFEELCFALFFVEDGAAFEEDVDFDFVAFFEEADGVVEFELEVVVVGLRAKAYFFDYDLAGLGFHLLLLFLEFVGELLVVDDFANGRLCIGGDFDEVETLVVGHLEGDASVVDGRFDAFADDANGRCGDELVDAVVGLFFNRAAIESWVSVDLGF